MAICTSNDIIATIPDPYKLNKYLDKFNVTEKSKGIFLSFVLDFYEMLADPNIKFTADISDELLKTFRQAAMAMLSETKNYELIKYYHCNPGSVYNVRKEVKTLIEKCDIYAV